MAVAFCGYNVYNLNHSQILRPYGSGDYLLLLFLAPFIVTINGTERQAKTNSLFLYSPDAPQNYHAVYTFKNSYVHFTADAKMIAQLNLPLNTILQPANHVHINQLLKQICNEHFHKQKHYERKQDLLVDQLLIDISREVADARTNAYGQELRIKFQQIRTDILARCHNDWSHQNMGDMAGMGKSQFYNYYRYFFNTSPKMDIINARIDKAKYLLSNEALNVNEIAFQCGFQNVSHFSRYFKKVCGCSPREFRQGIKSLL